MATATKKKPAKNTSKPVAKPVAKAKTKQEPAPAKAKKPFERTKEEQEASDEKFYSTVEAHGLNTTNPRTNKRISRFIVQAHALAQCWPTKPMLPAEIAEVCSKKFGIKVTVGRVERQLIDELRCGRVKMVGKKYQKTGVEANRWSMTAE
jgi:hypothetical protein